MTGPKHALAVPVLPSRSEFDAYLQEIAAAAAAHPDPPSPGARARPFWPA